MSGDVSKKAKRKKDIFVHLGKNKRTRPSQAPSSYAVFCKENTQILLATNPNLKFLEISKSNSESWRALTEGEKDVYKQKADSIKEMLFRENNTVASKVKTSKANNSAACNVDNTAANVLNGNDNSYSPTSTSTIISDTNRENHNNDNDNNNNDVSSSYDNSVSINTNSAINDNNTTFNTLDTTMTDSVVYLNNDN